jgi:hypothetical protein
VAYTLVVLWAASETVLFAIIEYTPSDSTIDGTQETTVYKMACSIEKSADGTTDGKHRKGRRRDDVTWKVLATTLGLVHKSMLKGRCVNYGSSGGAITERDRTRITAEYSAVCKRQHT